MGYKQGPVFVLVALVLLVVSNPMAHGQGLLGGVTNVLNISGILKCPGAGGAPLSGVPLTVNCTNVVGVSVVVGTTTTGVNGTFNVSVPNIQSLLGTPLSFIPVCTASVKTPIINLSGIVCPAVTTVQGLLTSTTVLATNLLSGLLGPILNLVLSGFTVTITI